MWEAFLPVVGFLIGLVSVMVGLGGGFLLVPLLTLVYAFSPANAVGTSLTTILISTAVASAYFSKQKQTYYKMGLILTVSSVPGAVFGSYLTTEVSGQVIGLLIGVFLVIVALQMINRKGSESNCENPEHDSGFSEKELLSQKWIVLLGIFLCFFAGLCGGLLGIPGVLLVPIMLLVLRMPFKAVAATSVFTMVFISFAGMVQHLSLGNVNVEYALLIGSGSMFGGLLGAYFCQISKSRTLRWVLSGLLLLISLEMFLKFGSGLVIR
ncbi:MAG: sulfite exporter TauE/SafE family protein [Candidatus Bathyarchaeia archaeon]